MSRNNWVIVALATCTIVGIVLGIVVRQPKRAEQVAPLTFVVHPAYEAETSREAFAPLVAYLERELSRETELFVAADYAAAAQAMLYGWADIGIINPVGYVMVKGEGANIEVVAAGVRGKTGLHYYQAVIVVRADSGIVDLNGKDFAFVDPMSTSGGLIPALYMKENKIELGKAFYAGSHDSVILAVKNGTVDAGSISDNRYYIAIENGVITEDEFEILWTSDLVPSNPVVVQSSLAEGLRDRIQQAFLNAPKDIVEHCAVGDIGYVIVQDSDYDINRRLVDMSEE